MEQYDGTREGGEDSKPEPKKDVRERRVIDHMPDDLDWGAVQADTLAVIRAGTMASEPVIDHSDMPTAARDIHREYGGPGIMLKMADEIDRQKDLIDFLQSERELGAAETFCGVPMREAMQIVLAAKEGGNDAV